MVMMMMMTNFIKEHVNSLAVADKWEDSLLVTNCGQLVKGSENFLMIN